MAIASQGMFQICRFCLCQEEALLIPLEDILDFGLAFPDVIAVTGIEINKDNIASYAMCLECTTKLKSSVAFRNCCLSNESHFQELCVVLSASFKESRMKIIDTIQLSDSSDESQDLDLSWIRDFADSVGNPQSNEDPLQNANLMEEREETAQRTFEFSYCANYILPGEIVFSEDEDIKANIDWDSSLNPPAPPSIIHLREKGKRKYHLCDICGQTVKHIPSHVRVHKDEYIYGCPHCPVKAKIRSSLNEHIKTVHLKKIKKRCDVCGKGFVHHKTYRYHMLTHQDEGKTFECLDCAKTFTNSICLRDHFNRLHNAGKIIQKKVTGDRIRRKRNRSRCVVDISD
ncbi:zinc finger protein 37 homolog [Anopheles moucheti]|uniref:zinc finger protein 37 homolog n=1 Tax=Anopheles moucheti TaxID=186751 RepID=UPI0022F0633F|nr:zinc finger protein 37 homolog [Anopheles moucheti]